MRAQRERADAAGVEVGDPLQDRKSARVSRVVASITGSLRRQRRRVRLGPTDPQLVPHLATLLDDYRAALDRAP